MRFAGFSIGFNWYLTLDEAHNGGDRHLCSLRQDENRKCDEEHWLNLKAIFDEESREAQHMETTAPCRRRSSPTASI